MFVLVVVLVLEKLGAAWVASGAAFFKADRSGFPISILLGRTAVFENEDDDEDEYDFRPFTGLKTC